MATDDLSKREDAADWGRWHKLLTIRDKGPMNASERAEYEAFLPLVAELDARDSRERYEL